MGFWDIFTQKKAPVLEFKVGEGLTPEQTATAYKNITNPDTALKEGNNSFWGKANSIIDTVNNEFTPQPTEVRRAFETTPKTFNVPPIVGQAADLGYRILEAIPRLGAVIGGEIVGKGQPTTIKANIDLRRLGFDTPEYVTVAKEQTDAINNGENPWISGLRIVSNKALDLAFGAQLTSDLANLTTKVLLSGGSQAKIEAQNFLDVYEQNQKAVFNRTKNAPLQDREKILADLLNTKKEAEKVIQTEGAPTTFDRAKVNASRYTELLGRQTDINKNFWSNIATPDVGLKNPIIPQPAIDAKQLPGYQQYQPNPQAGFLDVSGEPKRGKAVGFNNSSPEIINEKKATADWEANYAQDAQTRADEISTLQGQLKNAGPAAKPIIQAKLDPILAEDKRIEEQFIQKWNTPEPTQTTNTVKSPQTSTENIVPEIKRAFTEAHKGITTEVGKKNTDIVISAVDRLIAEGKVRVVSRDNRDVFQIKKGGQWVNARDESSAVKQLTKKYVPKPKIYSLADQQKIDFAKAQLENVRERLVDHPAKPLLKFIDKKEGQFLDFRNPDHAKNPKEAEKIKAKNKEIMKTAENAFAGHPELQDKFDNADTIKDVIAEYVGDKQVEKSLLLTQKNLAGTLKPTPSAKHISELLPKEIPQLDTTEGEGRSLEKLVHQAQDILSGEPFPINNSLPHIIEQTVTNVKQKVNMLDTYLRTPLPVMQKIGFGKEAVMLRDAMDAYWKELPSGIEKISNWLGGLKDDPAREAVFNWLDGKAITLPPVEKKIAIEIKNWLSGLADRLGVPAEDRIRYYITHLFLNETQMAEKEFDEELAKAIDGKIPKQVYDPFLLERKGVKGYREDLGAALDAYWKRAVRKVHIDPVLEAIQDKAGASLEYSNIEKSQFKYIQKYISNINMRPTEAEEGIDNFIKSTIGYKLGQRPVANILRTLRQATFRGMLGLNPTSALRNLSQGINTYAELKEKYTALGYMGLFKRGAGEELAREGVLNAGFVQDRALNSTKKAIQKMDKVLFSFFDTAEKINRGAAYFGAKAKGLDKGMSEDEAIKYAKSIVRKTQFVFDSIDTPVGISNDLAKTLLQFQTYTTKQIEFLAGLAKDRNFGGLIRYALAGLAFVYTIGKSFGMEPKELLPWYRFDTPPSLKAPAAIAGAVLNSPDKYGNKRSIGQKLKDVGATLINLIPGGGQAKKTIQGIEAVKKGGSYTSNGHLQFQQGQSKASIIQSILFGKYASQNAKDYFSGDTVAQKEFDRLSKLTPNEANTVMAEYKKDNPSLFDAIKKIKQDEKLGITEDDKKIRDMGVQNKERAQYIYKQALKLKTADERNAYLKDLRTKKIITDEVLKQIKEFKTAPASPNQISQLFGIKIAEAAGPANYYIRDNTISENDLEEAKAILFGEISNRAPDKQALEAQTILNTAFNRMDEYRKAGKEKTLTQVLQKDNQYQAYKGKQYLNYKLGKIGAADKSKLAAIDVMIKKVKDGTFQNNIKESVYYKHLKDGRISVDDRKLFKPKDLVLR